MLKGITMKKRDSAWHKKHLAKISKFRQRRITRLTNYRTRNSPEVINREIRKHFAEKKEPSFWVRTKTRFNQLFLRQKNA